MAKVKGHSQAQFNDIEVDITWHGTTKRIKTTTQAWTASTDVVAAVQAAFLAGDPVPVGPAAADRKFVQEFKGEQGLCYKFHGFRKTMSIARHARAKHWGYSSDGYYTDANPDRYILAAHRLRALKYATTAPDCPVKAHGEEGHVCSTTEGKCDLKGHGQPGHVCEAVALVPSTRQKVPKTSKSTKSGSTAPPTAASVPAGTQPSGERAAPEGAGNSLEGDSPSQLLQEDAARGSCEQLPPDNPMVMRRRSRSSSETGVGVLRAQEVLDGLTHMSGDSVVVHTIEGNGVKDTFVLKNWRADELYRVMTLRADVLKASMREPERALPPEPGMFMVPARLAEYYKRVGPVGAAASDAIRDLGPWGAEDPRASPEFGRWQDAFDNARKSTAFAKACEAIGVKVGPMLGPDEFGRPAVQQKNSHGEVLYVAEAV